MLRRRRPAASSANDQSAPPWKTKLTTEPNTGGEKKQAIEKYWLTWSVVKWRRSDLNRVQCLCFVGFQVPEGRFERPWRTSVRPLPPV